MCARNHLTPTLHLSPIPSLDVFWHYKSLQNHHELHSHTKMSSDVYRYTPLHLHASCVYVSLLPFVYSSALKLYTNSWDFSFHSFSVLSRDPVSSNYIRMSFSTIPDLRGWWWHKSLYLCVRLASTSHLTPYLTGSDAPPGRLQLQIEKSFPEAKSTFVLLCHRIHSGSSGPSNDFTSSPLREFHIFITPYHKSPDTLQYS